MNHPFRSIFILLLILLVNSLFADTLVYFNEVKFHSEFESKVFDGFFKENDEDYFAVCISGDTAMNAARFQTYKKQYNALVNDYKGAYYEKMKESKKVKKIFNGIHDQLLDKYVQNVCFTELFDSGYYHCLTGTMLSHPSHHSYIASQAVHFHFHNNSRLSLAFSRCDKLLLRSVSHSHCKRT